MVTLNNFGNVFQDEASIIKNLYEAPKSEPPKNDTPKEVDFEQIVKELQEIKASLNQGSHEYEIVASLEEDSKEKNWDGISSTITKYMSSFASGTLANLAGVYLSKLFQLG